MNSKKNGKEVKIIVGREVEIIVLSPYMFIVKTVYLIYIQHFRFFFFFKQWCVLLDTILPVTNVPRVILEHTRQLNGQILAAVVPSHTQHTKEELSLSWIVNVCKNNK